MSSRSRGGGYVLQPEDFLSPSPPPPLPEPSSSRAEPSYRLQRSSRRLVRPPQPRPPVPGGLAVASRRPSGLRQASSRFGASEMGQRGTSPVDGQPAPKRRKREAPFRGGQWEMAPLELQVVEVDGGMYHGGAEYEAELVLRNDKETYVSRGSSCSLTFEHTGKKAFTLQQLVVEAKADAYHPVQVQEGAVFVSMSSSEFKNAVDYEFKDSDDESGPSDEEDDDDMSEREDEEIAKKLLEPLDARTSLEYLGVKHTQLQAVPCGSAMNTMQPQARLYMSKKASRCVINFEPALSGRYIHARFYGRDNIEIRHIAAYGYTGARLFPALTPR